MDVSRVLAKNIAANWTGFLVQVAATFVTAPLLIKHLGASSYGAWSLIVGLTGYYGLLDLGFRAGLTQSLTQHLASGDTKKLNHAASTGFFALLVIALIVLVASAALAWAAPAVFNLPAGQEDVIRAAIVVMGISIAVQFPLFTFSAAMVAAQRNEVSSAIGIFTRVLTLTLTYLFLNRGHGLLGVCAATIAGNLLNYAGLWLCSRTILPQLVIGWCWVSPSSFRDFLNVGFWNFLVAGSRRLVSYTDTLLIAAFLPTAAIVPYSLALGMAEYFSGLLNQTCWVFFPAAAQLHARKDSRTLQSMYFVASRLVLCVSTVGALISSLLADDFFRLWVGFGSHASPFGSASAIYHILIGAVLVSASQRIGEQVLVGIGHIRSLSLLAAMEGATNLILSLLLVGRLGILGVAFGTLIPSIVFHFGVRPPVMARILGLSTVAVYWNVYARPGILVVACLMPMLLAREAMPPVAGWTDIVVQTALLCAIGAGLLVLIGLTGAERAYCVSTLRLGFGATPHVVQRHEDGPPHVRRNETTPSSTADCCQFKEISQEFR